MTSKEYLSRREASDYVRSRGLPCATATLSKLATIGGGPIISYFGPRNPRYRPADLDAWIASKLKICASTSELGKP